jgi:hypothetical protein
VLLAASKPSTEADALLQPHRFPHRLVLDRMQAGRIERALVEPLARLDHGRRPQQAADHVGADGAQVDHAGPPTFSPPHPDERSAGPRLEG